MPLPYQKIREATLQILYSYDFEGRDDEIVPLMMAELKTTRNAITKVKDRVQLILEKTGEIDPKIEAGSTEYRLERISQVERAILRLGIYELFFEKDVSPKIVIAEAIRLARKFGTPESAQFVNAILDGVYKMRHDEVSNESESL